ncbi:mitochondrial carrier domain-containing protein [Xylariaceae sp. FL1651]|nr:mitochondrial carrier domain-containing protein [Xylariaceae sp. FL1651]
MPPSISTNSGSILPALHHALSGSLGTLISTCTLYPLSLVITRLQVQRQLRREGPEYAGIADAFSQIWNSDGNGGPRAFYTGLAADAAKSVLDSFLFFLFYEWFRALRLSSRRRAGRVRGRGLGVVEELAVGMAAGACSRAFTTPIANVVTRKQTATLVDPKSREGAVSVRDIVHSIQEEKGIAGFWSGYSASLVLALNPSLTFFLQEFLKTRFAEKSYDDPGPQLTFLFAATSKAISSFVTYPFQIAKTRLQSGMPLDSVSQGETQSRAVNGDNAKFEEHTDEDRDIDRKVENKLKAVRTVEKLAQQTIFGTVTHLIRTEGVGSLYDGVQGELLRGFFSHGTTMLAKDVVHKLLFKLYFVIIGMLAQLRQRRSSFMAKRQEPQQEPRELPREEPLPRALRYRIDTRRASTQPGKMDYAVNVVANLIDGTQRPFREK